MVHPSDSSCVVLIRVCRLCDRLTRSSFLTATCVIELNCIFFFIGVFHALILVLVCACPFSLWLLCGGHRLSGIQQWTPRLWIVCIGSDRLSKLPCIDSCVITQLRSASCSARSRSLSFNQQVCPSPSCHVNYPVCLLICHERDLVVCFPRIHDHMIQFTRVASRWRPPANYGRTS